MAELAALNLMEPKDALVSFPDRISAKLPETMEQSTYNRIRQENCTFSISFDYFLQILKFQPIISPEINCLIQ